MNYFTERLTSFVRLVLDNPASFFLVVATVFGIIICFRIPPLTGTDEFTHFPRVYQISEGTLWEQKLPQQQFSGQLPQHVNNMVNDYRDLSRKSDPQEFANRLKQLHKMYGSDHQTGKQVTAVFTSVAIYPPWAYIPSLVGLTAAKLLHTSLIWYVYLARLSTVLLWICLVWLAIRLLPSGKWFLSVLALLPTSLSQAATVGGDGLLTGLSWLTIALVLAVFAKTIRLNWAWLAVLSGVSTYVAIIKVGYWLISLLPLVIPAYYFSNRRVAVAWKSAIGTLIVAASVLFARHTSIVASGAALTPRLGVNINSHLQQQYVLHHPLLFLARAIGQFFTKSYDTIYLGVVGILTNRLIYLPILIIGLLYLALFISLISSRHIASLVTYRRLLVATFISAFLGTCIFISLAFYIGNTQVGSNTIFGIYGRYYLPVLPLLLVVPLTAPKEGRGVGYYAALPFLSLIGLVYTVAGINR